MNEIKKETMLMNLEYELICDLIKLRKDANLSQQQLADISHIIRTTIARIENGMNSPQLKTLLAILEPLGFTLKIVPLEKDEV